MSDKFVIVPRFVIRARFDPQRFYPQETELREVGFTDTIEEALEVLASIKAHGGYDRAEIERRDVAFENGHSRGMVKREIVKTWRAGK